MIKLKSLLPEVRRLDLDKKEDAAEYIIRRVWKFVPSDDKYSFYQVMLWLDNERELSDEREILAKKFYSNENDPLEKFDHDIKNKLEKLENERNRRLANKINKLDPLFILKQIVREKTWEGAKQSLIKNTLGAWGYKGGKISDNEAEEAFVRLYKNAMGETHYEANQYKDLKRLSDIRYVPIVGRNEDNIEQYVTNSFIQHFTGYKDKFGDKVKVYRGTNNPLSKIRPGDYVTFDRDYADFYKRGRRFGSVISDILNSTDLLVANMDIDRNELIYWPEGYTIKKYEGHIPTFKQFWYEINSL